MTPLAAIHEHDGANAPWVDQDDFDTVGTQRQAAGSLTDAQRAQLDSWRRQGFLALRGAVPAVDVDRLVADYEQAWHERPAMEMLAEGFGVIALADAPPRAEMSHHHYRFLDFHDVSDSARSIVGSPTITDAVRLILDDDPVVMQSLYFEYGSEQNVHQDFSYVSAHHLSHLIGCWIALDDVDDDNGPLFYYEGSHRLPSFDWGEGSMRFDGSDPTQPLQFAEHIDAVNADAGSELLRLNAKKGDVLLWHSGLAHGGAPAHDRQRTRQSLVVHYSSTFGYPVDRRFPHVEPDHDTVGGAIFYREPATVDIDEVAGPRAAQTTGEVGRFARLTRRIRRTS